MKIAYEMLYDSPWLGEVDMDLAHTSCDALLLGLFCRFVLHDIVYMCKDTLKGPA